MREWINLVETDLHLRDVVAKLDGLLTGKPAEAMRNAHQRTYLFSDPATFAAEVSQDAYYLADGGYSRLMVNDEGEVRGLSQVSRQQVKDRWHDADVQALVRELAILLRGESGTP